MRYFEFQCKNNKFYYYYVNNDNRNWLNYDLIDFDGEDREPVTNFSSLDDIIVNNDCILKNIEPTKLNLTQFVKGCYNLSEISKEKYEKELSKEIR